MKLLCIPGGASVASNFYTYQAFLEKSIQIVPLEIKGRGFRFAELAPESISEIVEDFLEKQMELFNSDEEYSIFSFCSGSIICYELCKKLQENHKKLPVKIIISSANVPDSIENSKNILKENPLQIKELVCRNFVPDYFGDEAFIENAKEEFTNFIIKKYAENKSSESLENLDFVKNCKGKNEACTILRMNEKSFSMILHEQLLLNKYFESLKVDSASENLPAIDSDFVILFPDKDNFITAAEINEWKRFCNRTFTIEKIEGSHLAVVEKSGECAKVLNKILVKNN